MKHISDSTYAKRKKAKNTFSLGAFGHNLNQQPSSSTPSARAGNLTADGRRAAVRSLPIQRERDSASTPAPIDDTDWLDLPPDEIDETLGTEYNANPRPKRKRKWYATTVIFLFCLFADFC